jgi:hypothetical protein
MALGLRLGLTRSQARALARLGTPERIQDFVTALPTNFEPDGDTCWSVAEVLKRGRAHCIEGALVAACALWLGGDPPLLMDLRADGDDDHVVALFRRGRSWGAISKSNHVWLRWRDPVYRSLRELAMSYFHEYVFVASKTLRTYSRPFDLRRLDPRLWVANANGCWEVDGALDRVRHYALVTPAQAKRLRRRDAMEVRAGRMIEHAAPDDKTARRY